MVIWPTTFLGFTLTEHGVRRYLRLYSVEKRAKLLTQDQRFEIRRKETAPIFDESTLILSQVPRPAYFSITLWWVEEQTESTPTRILQHIFTEVPKAKILEAYGIFSDLLLGGELC